MILRTLKEFFQKTVSTDPALTRIHHWSKDNTAELTSTKKMERIRFIKDILNIKSSHLEADQKNDFLKAHFQKEIDLTVELLKSFDYSADMKNLFLQLEHDVAVKLSQRFPEPSKYYESITPVTRPDFLQTISDIYIGCAQREFPLLKSIAIEMVTDPKRAGFIRTPHAQVLSGDFKPIAMNAQPSTYLDDVKNVTHEVTHAIILQLVAMNMTGRMTFPPSIQKDLEMRQMQIETGTYGLPPSHQVYNADPDERLALRCGEGVRHRICGISQFKDPKIVKGIMDDLRPMIDAYSYGDKINPDDFPIDTKRSRFKTLFTTATHALTNSFTTKETQLRSTTMPRFDNGTTHVIDGTTINYFLSADATGDSMYEVRLLAKGHGMSTILKPPFLGLRAYHVSNLGFMNEASLNNAFMAFNEGDRLADILESNDTFIQALIKADDDQTFHIPPSTIQPTP